MYIIKNKKTGQYWTGELDSDEPDYYTSNINRAYVYYNKDWYYLAKNEEIVEVEVTLKEAKHG